MRPRALWGHVRGELPPFSISKLTVFSMPLLAASRSLDGRVRAASRLRGTVRPHPAGDDPGAAANQR